MSDIRLTASAAQEAGADAVVLINTLPGMEVDIDRRRPSLATGTGGLSGPAIRPVALRMVWEASRAVDLPIIGCGGICSARDVIAFMLAGATAVQIGSAQFRNPGLIEKILQELRDYLFSNKILRVSDMTGALKSP